MRLPHPFKPRDTVQQPPASVRIIDDSGVILAPRPETAQKGDAFVVPLASIELPAFSDQLIDDGYATYDGEDTLIPWDAVYQQGQEAKAGSD